MHRLLNVSLLVAAMSVAAMPAQACTVGRPGPLAQVVEELGWPEEGGGIYEQETIARAPPIFIRDVATASVVTRFWGRPPANVGVQYEGGEWLSFAASPFSVSGCEGVLDEQGNLVAPDGRPGTVGYGMAPPPVSDEGPLSPEEAAAQGMVPLHRTAPILELESGSRTGALSGDEVEALEAAYGPATVLETPFTTRVRATFVVWWPTLLAVALLVLMVGRVIHITRTRRGQRKESPSEVRSGTAPR